MEVNAAEPVEAEEVEATIDNQEAEVDVSNVAKKAISLVNAPTVPEDAGEAAEVVTSAAKRVTFLVNAPRAAETSVSGVKKRVTFPGIAPRVAEIPVSIATNPVICRVNAPIRKK